MALSRLVSASMPVYNGADFRDDAIARARSRSSQDIEIIIGNNASDDDTRTNYARHAAKGPRIVVLRSEVNRGAAKNFNRLVGRARGRYVKWAAAVALRGSTPLSSRASMSVSGLRLVRTRRRCVLNESIAERIRAAGSLERGLTAARTVRAATDFGNR